MRMLRMNKIFVACAGSGKTTHIVNTAMSLTGNILITTFTDTNVDEIEKKFIEIYGYKPLNVFVIPWFTFQIDYLIKPYQLSFLNQKITGICMVHGKSKNYFSKNRKEYYISSVGEIYSDKISNLAIETLKRNENTIKRLKRLFDYIFIDEFQDFAGYDLEIIKFLVESNFKLEIVCDPRQHTYSTHYALKNHKYSSEPLKYIEEHCSNFFEIDEKTLNGSFRCPQNTIRYASEIFSNFPQSNSNKEYEDGDGIVFVTKSNVESFLDINPNILQLRDSKKTLVNQKYPVSTFGKSKGITVENCIIYPTKPMLKAIMEKDFSELKSKSDLYVALTRAKHKTAIIISDDDYEKSNDILNHINAYLINYSVCNNKKK